MLRFAVNISLAMARQHFTSKYIIYMYNLLLAPIRQTAMLLVRHELKALAR